MQWFIYFVFNRGQLMEAVWRSHTKTMMASCFAPPTWLLPWNMLKHFCFNRFCCWKDSAPNPAHPTHAHLMITSVTDFFKHFLSQESHDNQPLHRCFWLTGARKKKLCYHSCGEASADGGDHTLCFEMRVLFRPKNQLDHFTPPHIF